MVFSPTLSLKPFAHHMAPWGALTVYHRQITRNVYDDQTRAAHAGIRDCDSYDGRVTKPRTSSMVVTN